MLLSLAMLGCTLPSFDAAADARLAKLRSTYAAVRSAAVQSTYQKVWESDASPAVTIDTVTYFERPNRISVQAVRRGETAPFLSYLTDGKKFRRTEDGKTTTGDFDPNESLPHAGVALEVLALWTGETLLKPGSRLLPHPPSTNEKSVIGPDGRNGWSLLSMPRDDITILIDPRTGLIKAIHVGSILNHASGTRSPRYSFTVTKWELGTRFPKKFFEIPEKPGL